MTPASADTPMEGAPISVFLSYSREDREKALPVIRALEGKGMQVWWDGLLEGGVAFARKTEDALENADAVVVLWSHRSVQSHWVKDEATRGRDRHRLVPASLDGAEPPLGFRQYQVLDLSKWKGREEAPEMEALVRAVTLAAGGVESAPSATLSSPPVASRRGLLIAGAVGGTALVGGLGAWGLGLFSPHRLTNSVAVLAFRNLSGDPAQEYLADGLSEEVRSTLARNPLLQVAAPTSTGKFKGHSAQVASIARQLNVAYILDGSVQRAGNMIRISAQLMDGKAGFSEWAQSFDRKLDDIFAIQSEIATTVAAALAARMATVGTTLHAKAGSGASVGGTTVIAAYDAYLKGRAAYESAKGEDADRQALALFDTAIAVDPGFAKAHAARSRALASIAAVTTQASELRLLYESAIVSAQKAQTLAPDLADAYSALGFALVRGRHDMRAAREPFEQSRALGWGDADVLTRYAGYCIDVGRTKDAEAATKRVLTLDPLNPRVYRVLALIQSVDGRYEDAIASIQRALAINPDMAGAHAAIGLAQFRLGSLDKARQSYDRESFGLFRQTGLSIIDYKRGDKAAADKMLAAILAEYGDNALYQKAEILAQRGDAAGALDALERGHEIGDAGLLLMRNDPYLDPLRSNPRFIRLLKQMGFD
jgi:TolB-like protein/tetratricopeptide (TPR) repeat protein